MSLFFFFFEEYMAVWLNLVTFVPDEQERKISKAV